MATVAEARLPPVSPITPADRLAFTLVMALLLHALLLFGIRFVTPKTQAAPIMEVTLVPAKSVKAPVKADFLAQAQQEGSGTLAEARLLTTRERTPLPGQGRGAQPMSPNVPEAVAAVAEQKQPNLISTHRPSTLQPTAQAPKQAVSPPVPPSPDLDADIAALEARLSASKQAYAKRPRIRTLAAVSTRQDDWAAYIDQFRQRVEAAGNASFPAEARAQRLQGQVVGSDLPGWSCAAHSNFAAIGPCLVRSRGRTVGAFGRAVRALPGSSAGPGRCATNHSYLALCRHLGDGSLSWRITLPSACR